jgi:hypothetical protein
MRPVAPSRHRQAIEESIYKLFADVLDRRSRDQVGISQADAAILFGVAVQDTNGFYSYNELNKTGSAMTVSKDQVRYILNGPGADAIFGTPYGDVPRNSETGPILNNLNLAIFKNLNIGELVRLQFRTEMFNALNHPNPRTGGLESDSVPDTYIDDAGTTFNRYDEMTLSRRSIQFGLRIAF